MTGYLDRFFEPKSVVIVGASATPHKAGNDVVQNILARCRKAMERPQEG